MRALLVVLLCCAVGCAEERPRLVVATDSASFGRTPVVDPPMADVSFTVTNRTAPAGFVGSCGNQPVVAVEQYVANAWTQYAGGYCVDFTVEPPIALRGGNWARGTVHIAAPGWYRLRLSYATSASFDQTFTALSRPFDVR